MNELTSADPQESEAQRIGRIAGKAFEALMPNSWMSAAGVLHDFGYDYQVQTTKGASVKNIFRAQLKGTKSPSLNADGSFYSVTLELSTVNYLARATEPVLLVLCILPEDEDILFAKLFHIWIHDELPRLRGTAIDESQDSVTFRVPSANRLDRHTDFDRFFDQFRQVVNAGHALNLTVQTSRPGIADDARLALVGKISTGLAARSPALIDALAEPPTSSWVDAKEGSPQWHLREAANSITVGRVDAAERNLDSVAAILTKLSPVEQADYWRQRGRLALHLGKTTEARDDFWKAVELAPGTPKNLAGWGECELRISFETDDEHVLDNVLAKLQGTDPSVVGTRARVLAAAGRYDEAVAVAQSIDGPERASTLAIVHMTGKELGRALEVCEIHLSKPDTLDSGRQVMRLIRARAKFALAVGGSSEEELPMTGPANANPDLLQEVWSDLNELVAEYRASNWPTNVEIVADIWGLTASILGHRASTIPVFAEAAAARPNAAALQTILEGLAATEGDFTRALEANLRLPSTSENLIRRVMLLHSAHRDLECVNLMEKEHDNLDSGARRYPMALAMATMSADRIVRVELANRWTGELETCDAWREQAALLKYFRSVEQNALVRDAALVEFEAAYERLQRPFPMGAQLFYELDASDADHATKIVRLGEEISQTRLLDLDGSLHWAQALATLGKWGHLLRFAEENIRRFRPNDRLQAVRALALDKLGRTSEAHAVLESLVAKSEPDPIALNTYIIVNSRLGFNDDAVVCLEKVLSTATSKRVKVRCLHALFNIEYLKDPTNPRLFELVLKLGGVVDETEEAEEGLYLVLTICATMTKHFEKDDPNVAAFQTRLKAFCTRFPNSKVLKQGSFPENASGDEILRVLRDMSGMTEEKWRKHIKTRNLLERGQIPFPYAWRPRYVLDGIPDLPTLWELGKKSKSSEQHLQLQMVAADWEAVPSATLATLPPLIDLVALFVLQDLNLLDALFLVFKKIAVSKATLHNLQAFLAPMSASPFRDKCASLQQALKKHFAQIEQPGLTVSGDDEGEDDEEGDVKMPHEDLFIIARRGTYRLYSDDVLFRTGAELPEGAPQAMCTLDLLEALDRLGHMTPQDVAKGFATLCHWKVFIRIPVRYQIAVLPEKLLTAKTISARIDALRQDSHASAMFDALWTIEKPLKELQSHGAIVLHNLILDKNSNSNSVAALAAWWVMKVKFHRDAPEHSLLPGFLVVHAAVALPSDDKEISRRLWNVHQSIVEHEYGDRMDESNYRSSIEILARLAATVDFQFSLVDEQSVGRRIYNALTHGTTDFDTFDAAYCKKRIELATSKSR